MTQEKPWHGEVGMILLLCLAMLALIGMLGFLFATGAFSG